MSQCCGKKTRDEGCLKVLLSLEEIIPKPVTKPTIKVLVRQIDGNLSSNAIIPTKEISIDIALPKEMQVYEELICLPNNTDVNAEINSMSVDLWILCETSSGEYEFLKVQEGQLLTINGEKLLVRKQT